MRHPAIRPFGEPNKRGLLHQAIITTARRGRAKHREVLRTGSSSFQVIASQDAGGDHVNHNAIINSSTAVVNSKSVKTKNELGA